MSDSSAPRVEVSPFSKGNAACPASSSPAGGRRRPGSGPSSSRSPSAWPPSRAWCPPRRCSAPSRTCPTTPSPAPSGWSTLAGPVLGVGAPRPGQFSSVHPARPVAPAPAGGEPSLDAGGRRRRVRVRAPARPAAPGPGAPGGLGRGGARRHRDPPRQPGRRRPRQGPGHRRPGHAAGRLTTPGRAHRRGRQRVGGRHGPPRQPAAGDGRGPLEPARRAGSRTTLVESLPACRGARPLQVAVRAGRRHLPSTCTGPGRWSRVWSSTRRTTRPPAGGNAAPGASGASQSSANRAARDGDRRAAASARRRPRGRRAGPGRRAEPAPVGRQPGVGTDGGRYSTCTCRRPASGPAASAARVPSHRGQRDPGGGRDGGDGSGAEDAEPVRLRGAEGPELIPAHAHDVVPVAVGGADAAGRPARRRPGAVRDAVALQAVGVPEPQVVAELVRDEPGQGAAHIGVAAGVGSRRSCRGRRSSRTRRRARAPADAAAARARSPPWPRPRPTGPRRRSTRCARAASRRSG